MGFSRHEYRSGLPFPPSGGLPNARIEPASLVSSALAGKFFTTSATWEVSKMTQLYFLECSSEVKMCLSLCLVTQSCLTLYDPMDCSPPGSSVRGNSSGKNTGVGCDAPNPGIKPRSPALQVDSLPPEPLVKPKNTGVGSLALLQGIFLTQESNWGLLNCTWILYQLS